VATGQTICRRPDGGKRRATGPALQNLNYDPVNDPTPLGGIGTVPNMMVVSPDSPFRSVQNVIAAARARPGEITYGSSGPGTGSHLAGKLLGAMTGTRLLHVPYRGSDAVYPDLISQRLSFLLDAMGSASAGGGQQDRRRDAGRAGAAAAGLGHRHPDRCCRLRRLLSRGCDPLGGAGPRGPSAAAGQLTRRGSLGRECLAIADSPWPD